MGTIALSFCCFPNFIVQPFENNSIFISYFSKTYDTNAPVHSYIRVH